MTTPIKQRILPKTVEVVDLEMVRILRTKTEAERLAIAWGMWRSARDMIRNLLRAEHPNWSETEVQREAARRLASGNQ
jgi:Rv0078B-related antitoxin